MTGFLFIPERNYRNPTKRRLTKYWQSMISRFTRSRLTKMATGQPSDMLIGKTIPAEAADAKASGNSNRTLQIIAATTSQRLLGATTNPQSSPGTTTNPQSSPGITTNPQTSPGTTTNPQPSPGTPTNPQHHSPSPVGEKASRELIERLKPILEKYSKK